MLSARRRRLITPGGPERATFVPAGNQTDGGTHEATPRGRRHRCPGGHRDGRSEAPGRQTKKPGKLIVGFDLPAPSFWNGRATGTTIKNPSGFEYALSQAIAKKLGITKVQYLRAPFGGLFSPATKKYDFALEEVTITAPRAKVVSFSTSYFDANQGVLIRKGLTKPKSIADLKKLQ